MKPNYVVCTPLALKTYVPSCEMAPIDCDSCRQLMWLPTQPKDLPPVTDPEAEYLCSTCFVSKLVENQLKEDFDVFVIGEENWKENQDKVFLASRGQLDQELAWIEQNLGLVCSASLAVFSTHSDPKHLLLWKAISILVWDVIQRRKETSEDGDIFGAWSDEHAKKIMQFMLWKPNNENQDQKGS